MRFIETGSYTVCGKTFDEWPEIWDFRKGRQSGSMGAVPGAFLFFCEDFLSIVVTQTKWNRDKTSKHACEIATVSDEALARLLVENNYHVWMKWALYE